MILGNSRKQQEVATTKSIYNGLLRSFQTENRVVVANGVNSYWVKSTCGTSGIPHGSVDQIAIVDCDQTGQAGSPR